MVVRIISTLLFISSIGYAQGLKDLLGNDDKPHYVTSTFKSTRIVTGQSVRTLSKGNLDFRMSHRFGSVEGGAYDIFGLDQATARFSFDYGITDDLMIGIGRTSLNKIYDGFVKYKFLKQEVGKGIPVTLAWNSLMEITTVEKTYDDYPFSGRVAYAHQLMIARKFTKSFSMQLTPSVVHFNMIENREGENTRFALGTGFRYKLSNRVSINAEYYIRLNEDDLDLVESSKVYKNALSIGFDIETGGHVFQLHFSNSRNMTDASYIDRTTGDIGNGGIYFGFNFTRTFKL
jgi:opacity protein-like surface antigen